MPDPQDILDDPLLQNLPVVNGKKQIGPVVIDAKIGAGGMGAVYLGKHTRLNLTVAVKIMSDAFTGSPEFKQRFEREAHLAVSITHTNLIRCYDFNIEAGLYYMILEFIRGWNLLDLLKRRKGAGFTESEIYAVLTPVLDALAEIHRQRIVHRDIKPENVMVTEDGRVVMMDLGLAKVESNREINHAPDALSKLTISGMALGTPWYMSPEQWTDASDVTTASDIWSLGIMMYQLATSRIPWDTTTLNTVMMDVFKRDIPDPRTVAPHLSADFCEMLKRCVRKEPLDRPAALQIKEQFMRLEPQTPDGRFPFTIDDDRATVVLIPTIRMTASVGNTEKTLIYDAGSTSTPLAATIAQTHRPSQPNAVRRYGVALALIAVVGLGALALGVYIQGVRERNDQANIESQRLASAGQFKRALQDIALKQQAGAYSDALVLIKTARGFAITDEDKANISDIEAMVVAAFDAESNERITQATADYHANNYAAALQRLDAPVSDAFRVRAKDLRADIERRERLYKQFDNVAESLAADNIADARQTLTAVSAEPHDEDERARYDALSGETQRRESFASSVETARLALAKGDYLAADPAIADAEKHSASARDSETIAGLLNQRRRLALVEKLAKAESLRDSPDLALFSAAIQDASALIRNDDIEQRQRLDALIDLHRSRSFNVSLGAIEDAIRRKDMANAAERLEAIADLARTPDEINKINAVKSVIRRHQFDGHVAAAKAALTAGNLEVASKASASAHLVAQTDADERTLTDIEAAIESHQQGNYFNSLLTKLRASNDSKNWTQSQTIILEIEKLALSAQQRKTLEPLIVAARRGEFLDAFAVADKAIRAADRSAADAAITRAFEISPADANESRDWRKTAAASGNLAAAWSLYQTHDDREQLAAAATGGLPDAQYELGRRLLTESQSSSEPNAAAKAKRAVEWLTLAVDRKNIDATVLLADCFRSGLGVAKDVPRALKLYYSAAGDGRADAAARIGDIYFKGDGVPANPELAYRWYKQAADGGDLDGVSGVGVSLYLGRGIEKNVDAAIPHLTRASESNATAQYWLGICRINGTGIGQNINTGRELVMSAANANEPDALATVGGYHRTGDFPGERRPVNHIVALEFYAKAAAQGNVEAAVIAGEYYYDGTQVAKDSAKARAYFETASATGNTRALYRYAVCLLEGTGGPADTAGGIRFLFRAADSGETLAEAHLGGLYANGRFVERDAAKALTYLSRASSKDEPNGVYQLGLLYLNGNGIAADIQRATELLTRASDLGQMDAAYALGEIYHTGRLGPVNVAAAAKQFYRAAAKGHPAAQRMMGDYSLNGTGVRKNDASAAKWYSMSAAGGDATAMSHYGDCLRDGRGIARNMKAAFDQYKKSADLSDPDGRVNYGLCLENGTETAQNKSAAFKQYQLASSTGHPLATYHLGRCYRNAIGTTADNGLAFKAFLDAANRNNVDAQYETGVCYEKGLGTERNGREALDWYKKASRAGHLEARKKVTASGSPW
ncbi:MAG: protein kinase [Planctomycetota bacterium]